VLILDVAETEPFLTAGAEIAAVETAAVISGLQIAARILGTEEVHIVVSRGFARAAHALRNTLPPGVARLHMVPHRYPGNTLPALRRTCGLKPGRDDQMPAIAISPATAAAIHEAVVYRKPHIDQVIAVGGSAVPRPAHIRVRHGISVFDVLAECGGLSEEPARIVAGGTLTGRLVTNVTAPVTKGMGAIIALTAEEVRAGAEEPCIGCGACARACPVALNPMLLNHLVLDGQLEQARAAGAMDCTECGLCAHVCPSRIPLVDRIREATHE
jgi:electron transport complex protein RnfC